ncbi:MAG: putative porin [Desulfobacteraceae bacterium]|nr:putative porin [Desulfobacteraceae bacterium]
MKKILSIFIAFIILVLYTTPVTATNTVSDENLSFFGDVRYRFEQDDRDHVTKKERDRHRIRARIGAKYSIDDNWGLRIRLATGANSRNSPHQTLGSGGSEDFGLDQAYIKYTLYSFNAKFGKVATDYWATSEAVFDGDIQDEGVQINWKGPITLHAGYFILEEAGWEPDNPDSDVSYTTAQAAYGLDAAGLNIKVALGAVQLKGSATKLLASDSTSTASVQMKGDSWRVAFDCLQGNADEEDRGYVAQARYKFTDWFGLRAYYYEIEAFASPGDGTFSQDNFPTPGSTGVSNFEGYRVQADFKAAKNVSIDLRYYEMQPIREGAELALLQAMSPNSDALLGDERSRYQLNLNLKF